MLRHLPRCRAFGLLVVLLGHGLARENLRAAGDEPPPTVQVESKQADVGQAESKQAELGQADVGQAEILRSFNQVYCRRDGEPLRADVYRPSGEGPFPAILMIHGGAWMSGSKWNVIEHANRAARRGYVVVAINYRLAPQHLFPAQIEDCRDAIRWVRRNADRWKIDTKRIGAYGYSAGGHLACLMALSASHPEADEHLEETQVAAVVAGGAPCDFRHLDEQDRTLAYFLGGTRGERPNAYRAASATEFASRQAPPIHFYHGTRDGLVPIASSRRLCQQLKTMGVAVSYDEVDEGGHLTTFFDKAAAERALDFLDSHLQRKPR